MEDVFSQNNINVAELAKATADSVAEVIGNGVTILMFMIDDDTRQVVSGTNFGPEEVTQFLKFMLAQQRAGDFVPLNKVEGSSIQ